MINLLNNWAILIHNYMFSMSLIRWGSIIIFIMIWPLLIERTIKIPSVQKYWKEQQWRIALWLILFELIVSQNAISRLIHLS